MSFCTSCGRSTADGQAICQECGSADRPAASAGAAMEQSLFSECGISVTTHRICTPGHVHAVASVSSTALQVIKPKRFWPILAVILGGLFLPGGIVITAESGNLGMLIVTLALLILGIVLLVVRKPKYAVKLYMAGGEQNALTTPDRVLADRMSKAVSDAIVSRR